MEEETRDLRLAVEEEVLGWPGVEMIIMMGCPSYMANGKMFASLVTRGMIITKLDEDERGELDKIASVEPFNTGSRIIRRWARIEATPDQLEELLPYLRISYERALKEAGS